MSENKINSFFSILTDSIHGNRFIKLTLSDRGDKDNELKNLFVKPVLLKPGLQLSFVYRYPTKDITKNYPPGEALDLLRGLIGKDFMKADLFTTLNDFHLAGAKQGHAVLTTRPSSVLTMPGADHDKVKKRYINPDNNIYLRELGVTTDAGKVKSDKQDKYRQINKYVEIIDGIVESLGHPPDLRIADMGSGKGYLTFALYDYLTNSLGLHPEIIGIEMRKELVDNCTRIAAVSGFGHLKFQTGSIDTTEIPDVDMLIALHACDIATDQAIFRGISGGSKVIICAPCCHKQIRKQIKPIDDLNPITRYGILEERQAEILTDTMRALILEAFGYSTKVFEFISTEHTPKNVMIVGVKSKTEQTLRIKKLEQLKNLKSLYGIEYHHLERLMGI